MFITLTIDTAQKIRPKMRMQKSSFNPRNGWQKAINVKKRTVWSKVKTWNRALANAGGNYKMGGQIAML